MELNSVFGEVTLVQALLHSMCLRTPEKGKPAPRGACSVQRLQAANANSTGSSEWGCLLSQVSTKTDCTGYQAIRTLVCTSKC